MPGHVGHGRPLEIGVKMSKRTWWARVISFRYDGVRVRTYYQHFSSKKARDSFCGDNAMPRVAYYRGINSDGERFGVYNAYLVERSYDFYINDGWAFYPEIINYVYPCNVEDVPVYENINR